MNDRWLLILIHATANQTLRFCLIGLIHSFQMISFLYVSVPFHAATPYILPHSILVTYQSRYKPWENKSCRN